MVLIDGLECLIAYPWSFCHLMGHTIASLAALLTASLKYCQLTRLSSKMVLNLYDILQMYGVVI